MTHSFLCSREMWRAQAEELALSYRVLNLDVRGHGDSDLGEVPFTLDSLADDAVAVLDAAGVERASWIGLSIGGMLSLRAALRHPQRVASLVLADSDGHQDPWIRKTRYRLMAAGARLLGLRPFVPAVAKIMFGSTTLREQPELVAQWSRSFSDVPMPTVLAGVEALCRRRSLLDQLGSIGVPTLVLVGAEDQAQPPERSRMLVNAIPGASLAVIPGAGHLSALEQPVAVSRAILEFLDERNRGRRES